MTSDFTPTVYLKRLCPHCYKLRVFLLEAGLIGKLDIRQFAPGDPHEEALRAELAPHFEKVTFPSAEVAPGDFRNESDALVDWFADKYGIDKSAMETFNIYVQGPYKNLVATRKELRELKEKAA